MPPPPIILDLMLGAVLPALAAAAAVMAVVLFLGGMKQASLGAALGLSAGLALGWWLREGLTLISSDSPWNRLPWAALAALWLGRVARFPQLQPSAGWFLRAATAIAIAWLVIPAATRQETDWLAPLFAAIVFALWTLMEHLAAEPPGGSVPFCLAVVFLAVAGVLIHAGSARLMNASIVLAAALSGIALVAWAWRADASGAIPAAAVMLPGLLLMGQQETFSEVPWYAFALPALAPLLLAEALPLSDWQPGRPQRIRFLLMMLVLLIPLVAALILVHLASPLDFAEQ